MSTIQDVAREAGVSVSTISNVLNGRTDRMRPDTLQRVEAAIAALDYRPNRAARQLKTGQTPMLGLLVPEHRQPDVRLHRARDRDLRAGAARPPRRARQHLPQQGQGDRASSTTCWPTACAA